MEPSLDRNASVTVREHSSVTLRLGGGAPIVANGMEEFAFDFQRVNDGTVMLPRFWVDKVSPCDVIVVVVGAYKAIIIFPLRAVL